jgi:hypothetical protein
MCNVYWRRQAIVAATASPAAASDAGLPRLFTEMHSFNRAHEWYVGCNGLAESFTHQRRPNMRNDSLNAIDLDQLAFVTGGSQLPRHPPPLLYPTYKSANGKTQVFPLSNGNLRIENLARNANPRSVIVKPLITYPR